MDPSAFDRLIAMLPPERRAAAAVSLVGMSDDPDGPIATLYSEIFEHLERVRWDQRADHETREKQLLEQLEKARMANQETIRTEVSRLDQGKFWHRMLVSRLASAAIWLVLQSTRSATFTITISQIDEVRQTRKRTFALSIRRRRRWSDGWHRRRYCRLGCRDFCRRNHCRSLGSRYHVRFSGDRRRHCIGRRC